MSIAGVLLVGDKGCEMYTAQSWEFQTPQTFRSLALMLKWILPKAAATFEIVTPQK